MHFLVEKQVCSTHVHDNLQPDIHRHKNDRTKRPVRARSAIPFGGTPALLARDSIIATSASLATTTWSTTRSRHDGLPSVSRVPTCRLPAPGHRVAARRAVSKAADHLKGGRYNSTHHDRRPILDQRPGPVHAAIKSTWPAVRRTQSTSDTRSTVRSTPRSNRHGPPSAASRCTRPTWLCSQRRVQIDVASFAGRGSITRQPNGQISKRPTLKTRQPNGQISKRSTL